MPSNEALKKQARDLIRRSVSSGETVYVDIADPFLEGAILDVSLPHCSTSREGEAWVFHGQHNGKPWAICLRKLQTRRWDQEGANTWACAMCGDSDVKDKAPHVCTVRFDCESERAEGLVHTMEFCRPCASHPQLRAWCLTEALSHELRLAIAEEG